MDFLSFLKKKFEKTLNLPDLAIKIGNHRW